MQKIQYFINNSDTLEDQLISHVVMSTPGTTKSTGKRKKTISKISKKNHPTKKTKELIHGNVEDFCDYLDEKDSDTSFVSTSEVVAKESEDSNMADNQSSSSEVEMTDQPQTNGIYSEAQMIKMFEPILKQQNDSFMRRFQILEQSVKESLESMEKAFGRKLNEIYEELEEKSNRICALEYKNDQLEYKNDQLEQLSRGKTLWIQGIPEKRGENTKDVLKSFAKDMLKVDINTDTDVDDCFRVGKSGNARPLVVKLTKQSTKNELYRAKKNLRDIKEKYFVNEDLTKMRSELFKEARDLKKEGYIWRTWTSDGQIFGTLGDKDKPRPIENMRDIEQIRTNYQPKPTAKNAQNGKPPTEPPPLPPRTSPNSKK